jgi:pimeloyl-ACP methyl ester carboxylesterase
MNGVFGKGYSSSAPNEQQVVYTPNNWKGNGTKTGIVYCHSFGAIAQYGLFPTTNTSLAIPAMAQQLARCGWPIIGSDQAGDSWGNSTGTSRVDDGRSYLQSTVGAKAGKVVLFAWSEGGCVAMNYARINPANVLAMVLLQPASDLNDIYVNNRGNAGAPASLDAAFSPGWNPTTHAASSQGFRRSLVTRRGIQSLFPSQCKLLLLGWVHRLQS